MVEDEVRVFISPNYFGVPAHLDNGGIRRVVEAENKHLEKFGVRSAARIEEAHIIQNHGGMQTWRRGIPVCNTSHGLFWSRQPWGDGYKEVNQTLADAMSMAVAVTAPSEWVARSIRRGMLHYPEVVYHGVDAEECKIAQEPGSYILWNKARADLVSNPEDMQRLASMMPKQQFLTTVGRPTSNVKVIGTQSYNDMKDIVASAGVYLSTARETFGIGTLEALASGIPVAGWDWGGNSEIILQGETGYLAYPGDYARLKECIELCLAERERLSANCVEDARTRWKWEPRIEQYANIFKRVYADFYLKKRTKVSVIVTAYHLDQYLPKCLESVIAQNFEDFECLVIDDAQQSSTKKIVEDFAARDKRISYLPTPENLGLPGARNYGFSKASGRYIRHVDADDWLAENALALEAEALESDPYTHIVYGSLGMANADGSIPQVQGSPQKYDWPPKKFSWIEQMAHLNQIPSCTMMRREVMINSGGYRNRMKRNEDAEFWCRTTSLGFRAKKFTEAITYFHRQREDSKGAMEWKNEGQEPDWTAWFPWRIGAKDFREAGQQLRKFAGIHPDPKIVPFGAQGECGSEKFWPVNDHAYPVVSVIVTCGPGHKEWLIDALDSIQAQSYPDWECIVINDTGEKWGRYIRGAPWATVINMDGNQGTAAARNEGFRYTTGNFIVWMDADDYWLPWFLEKMVALAEQNDGIIYSDLITDDAKEKRVYKYSDIGYHNVPFHMSYPGSSILIPRKVAEAVINLQGGYDKEIPGMEDWDYQIACHALGFCAYHIAEPLFVYRTSTSTKREKDYARIEEIKTFLDRKWTKYRKGETKMSCGCQQKKKAASRPSSTYSSSGLKSANISLPEGTDPTEMVGIEYVGAIAETFSIRSRVDPSINYRFGNNPLHKQRTVFIADAHILTGMVDGQGKPTFRILSVPGQGERDPSEIVGAIAA